MDPLVQVSKKCDRRVPGEDYGTSGNAGGGTPIRHKRREGHTSAGGRTSSGIPPHSGTATLHGELKRVLKYLNDTKFLKLTLSIENLGMLKWYVDGSHNVHWDCKGHGGAVFKLGKGTTTSYS